MAKFIGSNLHSDNWGEDFLIEKLVEYFDDSYVIYRNRMVFGAQFDVCLLAPGIGIVIFEVKAWKPQTIKEVINGDRSVEKFVNSYQSWRAHVINADCYKMLDEWDEKIRIFLNLLGYDWKIKGNKVKLYVKNY